VPPDRFSDKTFDTFYFSVTINGNTIYKARFDYTSFNLARLYLYDLASGNQLFDSSNIDLPNNIGL